MAAQRPRLRIIDGFVDEPLLRALRAVAADPSTWPGAAHRDETGIWADVPTSAHPALEVLAGRLVARFDLDDALGPGRWRLHRYGPGEGRPPRLEPHRVGDLQLYACATICLDAPERGGALRFPEASPAPIEITPRLGRLALWYTSEGREPEPAAICESAPVVAGVKTTLTWWAYGPPPPVPPKLYCIEGHDMRPHLARACAEVGIPFEPIHPGAAGCPEGPLPPGTLLLCLGDGPAARQLERRLWGPGVATVYQNPQGPLRAPTDLVELLRRAGVPVAPGATIYTAEPEHVRAVIEAVGGLPVTLSAPDCLPLRVDTWAGAYAAVAHVLELGALPHAGPAAQAAAHRRLWLVGQEAAVLDPLRPALPPEAISMAARALEAIGVSAGVVELAMPLGEGAEEGAHVHTVGDICTQPPGAGRPALASRLLAQLLTTRAALVGS